MEWKLVTNFAAAMLALVGPVGNLPLFLSHTHDMRPRAQRMLAVFVSIAVFGLAVVFLFTGGYILRFFGIRMPAFRIAGGILLLLIGIGMVLDRRRVAEPVEALPGDHSDIAAARTRLGRIVVPLVIPMFVGPGTISTVILFSQQVDTFGQRCVLAAVLAGVVCISCLGMLGAHLIQRMVGRVGMAVANRILGLILSAIAVQFMIDGIAESTTGLIRPESTNVRTDAH